MMSMEMAIATAHAIDHGYDVLESIVAARLGRVKGPLFTTDVPGGQLWEAYLEGLPIGDRQYYRCSCCLHFVEQFGGLVTVDDKGDLEPLVWGDAAPREVPGFFAESVLSLMTRVSQARIVGVFLSANSIWGTPRNPKKDAVGEWTHLSGANPNRFAHPLKSAAQAMAEKAEEFRMLHHGLADYPLDAVRQAVRVLDAEVLDRSEKALGIARWLLDLHERLADVHGPRRDNLLWRAVATAPPGFCHVRSTMISTLLDDILAGLDFDALRARWAKKMHPLAYQRPTALKEGNLEQANRIVARLQSEGSLHRRFARLEEVTALWRPQAAEAPAPTGGAFDHLRSKAQRRKALDLPPIKMTWEKFTATVLPQARQLEFLVPAGRRTFFGMATAADATAPLLFQWANPFSLYFYVGGSEASRWGLTAGAWVRVNAVCSGPPHWQDPEKARHHTEMACFLLDGAKDTAYTSGGAFFPEYLRSEYHEIRAAMEAYARTAVLAGKEEGTANGIALQRGCEVDFHVRVRGEEGMAVYRLDRWN